ncbi:MAG: GntR family transcriptional regulator [Phycisphaerales bacterium]
MPEYNRLYNSLRDQILDGHYAAGQMLPPERDLCKDFGVSRITARHAIRLLQEQGLVERFQGRGTYIRSLKPKKFSIVNCDFSGSIRKNAPEMTRKLVSFEKVLPPQQIAEQLNLNNDEECILAKRADVMNKETVAYDRAFIPLKYSSSLNEKLLIKIDFLEMWTRAEKIKISYGTQNIEATGASNEDANILGIKPDSHVLFVTDIVFNSDAKAVAVFESVYRGDKIKLISTNNKGTTNVKITD